MSLENKVKVIFGYDITSYYQDIANYIDDEVCSEDYEYRVMFDNDGYEENIYYGRQLAAIDDEQGETIIISPKLQVEEAKKMKRYFYNSKIAKSLSEYEITNICARPVIVICNRTD